MSPVEEDYDQPLAAALKDLAAGCTTADEVARKLAEAGCKGLRAESCDCPVWAWISSRVHAPAGAWIHVGTLFVRMMRVQDRLIGTARVPCVISEFIRRFDQEDGFSELENSSAPQAG